MEHSYQLHHTALFVLSFVLTLLATVVLKAAATALAQFRARRLLARYDGPEPGLLWGNAGERRKHTTRINDMHVENVEKYCSSDRRCYLLLAPTFFKSIAGSSNELVTADPVMVEHVLHTAFDRWAKSNPGGRVAPSVQRWLGQGIFLADHGPHAEFPRDAGRMWQSQRKVASTIFTRQLFRTFYEEVFVAHSAKLVAAVRREGAGAGGAVAAVDLQRLLHDFTMDAFAKIAFGAELDTLGGGHAAFGAAFDGAHRQVILYMRTHLKALLLRELLPTPLGDVMQEYCIDACSPVHQELVRHTAVMRRELLGIIDRKRRAQREGDGPGSDLLGLLIRLAGEGGGGGGDKHAAEKDEQLCDMLTHFVIAGRDTTACTLAWMFFELGRKENASVLQAAQEEVDRVLQGSGFSYDDLNALPYLRGVLWETLRLHPVVPLIMLVAKTDDTLPDGVFVPRGTRMSISNYAMGRSRAIWGEDALQFRPERWIPFKQPSPYEMPAFKGGRRICLGKDMALFEATTAAATLLQSFSPETVDESAVHYAQKLTMSIRDKKAQKDQLLMRMVPRKAGG